MRIANEAAVSVSALELEEHACRDGRVGEVREQTVDAEAIELQVLVDRIAGIVILLRVLLRAR